MGETGFRRTELESESNLRHNSLYSRHSQNYIESVSVEISSVMTRLGYGEKIRRWRVETNREYSRLENGTLSFVTMITTGSKAEGLTCCFESDWDFLRVLNDFLCVETGINLHNIPDDKEVYRMDTGVYSGYCRLFLDRQAPRYSKIIHNALCDNGDGDVLLSSGLFLDEIWTLQMRSSQNLDGLVVHERAGPSIPQSVDGVLHMDFVIALPCHCPSILQRWATRPRHWPQPAIVQKVVSLGTYLTPVGFKGSKYRNMEWRICFNTGEAELVNNLNETQAKVYVMLKMILKDILKPCNKEITPFVLKNIILWQAENNPQTNFHARSLLHWLHDGLRELRTAIEKKQLRYFMIPERNLMAACGLEDALQHKWVADITDMMDAGPRVILRLPKIRKAIIASPEPMLWFSKTRMELEMVHQAWMNRRVECTDNEGVVDTSDFILEALDRRRLEILIKLRQRIFLDGKYVNDLYGLYTIILM